MSYFVKTKRILLETEEKKEAYFRVESGRFQEIVEDIPSGARIIDFSSFTIAPGLFDTHIHGVNGFDVMDGTTEAIQGMSEALLSLGVTRFLPTTLTSNRKDLEKAIRAIKAAVDVGLSGAQSTGIFMEGPYFTAKYKGAQNAAYFLDPDLVEFYHWQKLAGGQIIKIALAPERKGALEFINQVTDTGVRVGIAHTDASYRCCRNAIRNGATIVVHLFNGMSGLHHRNPGVAGAALMEDNIFTELICDGHHIHPDVAVFSYNVKQNNIILITDCMRAGMLDDGNYMLGDSEVVMQEGIVRTETGSLAGSTLTLIDAIKNLQTWSEIPLYKIWHLASLSPAKSLKLDEYYGSIAPGKIADFVVINDQFEVQATAVAGEIKYQCSRLSDA